LPTAVKSTTTSSSSSGHYRDNNIDEVDNDLFDGAHNESPIVRQSYIRANRPESTYPVA
jgi:hypothetical protein